MLTGEMAQAASLVIVLVVAAVNVMTLVAGLRSSGGKASSAVGRFVRGMVIGVIFLPLVLRFLNLPVQSTGLLWMLLVLGVVVSAVMGVVRGSQAGTARAGTRQKAVSGQPGHALPQRSGTPVQPEAEPYPWLESELQAPGVGTTDRAIARLPLPFHKTEHPPLASEVAEGWFKRQDARLGSALQGKELAAARLRLSTVKSMLLLGYLSVAEADKDVEVVIREGRRA